MIGGEVLTSKYCRSLALLLMFKKGDQRVGFGILAEEKSVGLAFDQFGDLMTRWAGLKLCDTWFFNSLSTFRHFIYNQIPIKDNYASILHSEFIIRCAQF